MVSGPRAGAGERRVQQDFIARVRYSNALPPPPNPPKLLDIPNTGLASGQYTNPGFASRLAREQPLNIEADAELGMPLNLVGMPGVFDGDERSIQAPAQAPAVHPHDRALLRPLAALGKHKVAEASVSFLRRTEYISSLTPKRVDATNPRALLSKTKRPIRRPQEAAADSPEVIKRKIDQSFEKAEQELKDPKRIKHPSKKHLTLVDASPLVPDLDAFPDSGAYVTIKFLTNPMTKTSKYDTRFLTGLFRPVDKSQAEEEDYAAALEAHELDPDNNPKPQNMMNYDFYLGRKDDDAKNFRKKFDVDNEDNEDEELYTNNADDGGYFRFQRLRAYETAQEVELVHPTKYNDEILLAYGEEDAFGGRQKAVYYYPVMQKSTIRPQRTKNIARTILPQDEEEQIVDDLDITVHEAPGDMKANMAKYKETPLGWEQDDEEDDEAPQQQQQQQQQQQRDADVEEDGEEADAPASSGRARDRRSRSASEQRDGDSDDDDDDDSE